jgi:hypothetical protein
MEVWKNAQMKIRAYMRAFHTVGLDIKQRCLLELIPHSDLITFYECKNKITKHVFESQPKPDDYEFFNSLHSLLHEIGNRSLIIEEQALAMDLHKPQVHGFWKQVKRTKPYIIFDMFKSKTGRLTTCRGSFPILTMAKDYRKILKPRNDYFVELDYNAAELRTLLALSGAPQPDQDVHQWNVENVYRGLLTRAEAKKRIFEWLYNPQSKDYLSERVYKKEHVKDKYYNGRSITNPFNREIECDDHHALNYLIQSTASDMFLRQVLKIQQYLKTKSLKSFISFMMHDSIILDMTHEECGNLQELKQLFAGTNFGVFGVSCKRGINYGEIKELQNEA